MFTAPKFRVGEIVFAKDPKFAGPLTTTSFNPKKGRNKKGYVIGVKDKDGNLFSLDEEQLVAVDKAFFLVRCEYVWDCDRTDINAIFTNKYNEAKEVFDEKVKESMLLIYSSSNTAAADVSAAGKVTARKAR